MSFLSPLGILACCLVFGVLRFCAFYGGIMCPFCVKVILAVVLLVDMSETQNQGVKVPGVPVKIQKHDGGYKVVAVPKSAVPEYVLRADEVQITLGTPQQGTLFVIEARKWLERVRYVYYVTRKPYSDFLNQLARQGVRTLLMYNIVPKGP